MTTTRSDHIAVAIACHRPNLLRYIASKESKQISRNKTRKSVNLATGLPNLKLVRRLGAGQDDAAWMGRCPSSFSTAPIAAHVEAALVAAGQAIPWSIGVMLEPTIAQTNRKSALHQQGGLVAKATYENVLDTTYFLDREMQHYVTPASTLDATQSAYRQIIAISFSMPNTEYDIIR